MDSPGATAEDGNRARGPPQARRAVRPPLHSATSPITPAIRQIITPEQPPRTGGF